MQSCRVADKQRFLRGRGVLLARLLLAPWGMSTQRLALGKTGEDLACQELERRGYAIVARRYRRRSGEIDIVARDGPTLVFVEVKAREGRDFGGAAEAVTALKRHRVTRMAVDYLAHHHVTECPCRFDVVTVHFESGKTVIEVFQNAFEAASIY